jgi:hypothetical protein
MGFPVETVDGEAVIIVEKLGDGTLVAEDGRTFKASFDALRVEAVEAVEALKDVGEAVGEAVDEVGDVVEAVGDMLGEMFGEDSEVPSDPVDAVSEPMSEEDFLANSAFPPE